MMTAPGKASPVLARVLPPKTRTFSSKVVFEERLELTVAAEVADDVTASIRALSVLLGSLTSELEVIFGDDKVGGVGRAGDLLAVDAVAEGLSERRV